MLAVYTSPTSSHHSPTGSGSCVLPVGHGCHWRYLVLHWRSTSPLALKIVVFGVSVLFAGLAHLTYFRRLLLGLSIVSGFSAVIVIILNPYLLCLICVFLSDNRYCKFIENSRIRLTRLDSRRMPVAACTILFQLLVMVGCFACFFFLICLVA